MHDYLHFAILEVNGSQHHTITPTSPPPRQSGLAGCFSHFGRHPPHDAVRPAQPPQSWHLELATLILLSELGGILFGAGVLSTLFEYTFRRDQEESTVARFRQTIHDEAPTLRDALIDVFRIDREDLHRIATPELLDDLARTSLGLRFGDPAFG